MPEFLKASDISKQFDAVRALRDVSISLNRGEIRCLVGENGSGKSTLIKILAGIHQPDGGRLAIGGRSFSRLRPIDAIRLGIQVIYQDLALFPNLTVEENLAINTQLENRRRWIRWRDVRTIAERASHRMGIEFDMSRTVGDMSIAEHQLIAIGRALIQDPRLIIMDEPTAALSQREVDRLFGIIRSLQKDGISVLFVSHKLGEVLEISETITVLRNGTNAAEGKREDFDQKSLAHAMTGRIPRIREYRQQPVSSGAQGILEVEDLSRKGGFRNVSFQLHSGEVVGITGLLGSGRTELARSLFGIDPADSGAIRIDGLPVAIRRVADALRCGIACVPEDRLGEGLFLDQSVERNLVVGILDSLQGFAGLLSPARIRDRAESWIDRFAINTPDPGSAVRNLSGGNQQKTVLARWMATEARILILNGPTMGVDVAAKADILDRVVSLADAGMAVLILSDDLPELVHTCSRIFLMHRGCLIEEFAEGNFDAEILAHKLTALR